MKKTYVNIIYNSMVVVFLCIFTCCNAFLKFEENKKNNEIKKWNWQTPSPAPSMELLHFPRNFPRENHIQTF